LLRHPLIAANPGQRGAVKSRTIPG
jgi:hypothetical protein